MTNPSPELLHGTLDTLVLKTLPAAACHGYGIARAIEEGTDQVVDVEEGSLYPALYRMERKGWIEAEWGMSELGRRAKFYRLTPADASSWRHRRRNGRGLPAPCRASCWRRSRAPAMGFFNRVAWRPKVDREVDDELAFHLEMRTRESSRAAWTPRRRAAKRKAVRQRAAHARGARHLGQGRNRHMQRTEYLSELRQDIGFAWRS